jgi:hypothetical protein
MFETSGFDEQARSRYSMDDFFLRETDSVPRRLYDYWSALPVGSAGLPDAVSCRPRAVLPRNIAEWVSWIDTTADDPMEFILWDHCPSPVPGLGEELSGRSLGDVREAPLHFSACAIEYLYCKHERTPMYHEIEQILCGYKRHYTRIMVPVADENGSVSRIYYAIRCLRATRRVKQTIFGEE